MFRRPGGIIRVGLCLPALVVSCALAGNAHAQSVDGTCDQVSPSATTCIGTDKLAEAGSAECRRAGGSDSNCAVPVGHQVYSQEVSDYQGSWPHRAAAFQYGLGDSLPLVRSQWLGTHNSFNSVNDSPTASHTDSNQQLSLTQQLDIDMRALELDVHYVPSLEAGGSKAVVVCHGLGPSQENFGCTNEPLLSDLLPKIRS